MRFLILLILMGSLNANVIDLLPKDFNIEADRDLVINAQYDQGELISKESLNIKINSIYKEINLNKLSLGEAELTVPIVSGDSITSAEINSVFSDIYTHINDLHNTTKILQMVQDESTPLTTFAAIQNFTEGDSVQASSVNQKFNLLSEQLSEISVALRRTNATNCQEVYNYDNSVQNGQYRLKAQDGTYYSTYCRFESGTAYTLVASFKNYDTAVFGYNGSGWNNNYDSVNTSLNYPLLSSAKTKAWKDVSGSELLIISSVTNTKNEYYSQC